MLASFAQLLEDHRADETALGAFTCYGMESAVGVLRAAERRGVPVILLCSAQAYASPLGESLLAMLLALAERSSVPSCVQLDHVSDTELIGRALRAGVQAVMADGSRRPYEENIALVCEVQELARSYGAHLEVELGHVAGDEELAVAAKAGALTDPEQAEEFVKATGASCLAVSIGNVHGRYAAAPRLDLRRLEQIASRVEVPLSLHGASGLDEDLIRKCIARGIVKVNVNTELRERYLDVVSERLSSIRDGLRLLELGCDLSEAIAVLVAEKLELLDLAGEAPS